MAVEADLYEAVSYGGFVNPNSHPAQMAAMALLHGLQPAAVEGCRVLEIGCNQGRNLIPMACALPGATFVGVDLAAGPIARGQERIGRLGLGNIRLMQGDLMDLERSLGPFDYIIAHGVYAWVPGPVRDGLLRLCRELLTENGVAFISYNALPGGHLRNMVRDILVEHLPESGDRLEDVGESLMFLQFVMDARPEGDPWRALLEGEMKQLEKKGRDIIFHDELAPGYGPVSFAEFVGHARRHGLEYVCEASMPPPTDPCFDPGRAATVKALAGGDAVRGEQIFDLLRFRMFRETLICRAEQAVSWDLDLRALGQLRLACLADVAGGEGIPEKTAAEGVYRIQGGVCVGTQHPRMVALVDALRAAWPHSLTMGGVEEVLGGAGFGLDAGVVTQMFRLIVARLIQVRAWEPPLSVGIGERPQALATSREDAVERTRAATLIHTVLDLGDPLVRQLLALLDGTRDRAALLREMCAANPQVPLEALEAGMEPTLEVLYRGCVLVGE